MDSRTRRQQHKEVPHHIVDEMETNPTTAHYSLLIEHTTSRRDFPSYSETKSHWGVFSSLLVSFTGDKLFFFLEPRSANEREKSD